jgi:hypothetical protein
MVNIFTKLSVVNYCKYFIATKDEFLHTDGPRNLRTAFSRLLKMYQNSAFEVIRLSFLRLFAVLDDS